MAGITLVGVNQLFADLDARAKDIEQRTDEAINQAGETCLAEAKSRARVRTGRMRSEIRHEHTHLSSLVIAPTPYAPYNEFGTVKMSPQPFMRPGHRVGSKQLQQTLRSI
jgi:HK97 gp10 family phage protein